MMRFNRFLSSMLTTELFNGEFQNLLRFVMISQQICLSDIMQWQNMNEQVHKAITTAVTQLRHLLIVSCSEELLFHDPSWLNKQQRAYTSNTAGSTSSLLNSSCLISTEEQIFQTAAAAVQSSAVQCVVCSATENRTEIFSTLELSSYDARSCWALMSL